jgi:multiple sugar transport system substrate-binding protein
MLLCIDKTKQYFKMEDCMLKKILIVVVLAGLVLSACGGGPPTPAQEKPAEQPKQAEAPAATEAPKPTEPPAATGEETITVILPKHEADLVGFWPARIKEFETQTGIKVTLINMSWDKVADKVLAEMAAGGESYDVIEFDNSWVAKFCSAGWLEPLDGYMPKDFTKDMVPGLVSLFSCQDKVYGTVWNNDIRFLLYNQEILDKAGIKELPKTWDQLVKDCETIQEKGIVKTCLAQPWEQAWALVNEWHFFTSTYGAKMLDEGNKFAWNKDGAVEALQFMQDLIQKNKIVGESSLTFSQEASANVFLTGEAAFYLQAWPSLFVSAQDAKLSKVVGKVKVGLVPGSKEGVSGALALPEAMSIPKNSKHKEAAWKFIEFMTNKQTNKMMADQIGAIPIYGDLYNDPDLLTKYPYWKEYGAQLATAQGLMKVTWLDQWGQIAMVEIQKCLAGKQTAQQAVEAIYNQTKDFEGQP